MPVLQLALAFAGVAFLYVSWASWAAGYGPDVAVVRGLIAFMAVSLVGYIGELIIATAPPSAQRLPEQAAAPGDEPAAPAESGVPLAVIGNDAGTAPADEDDQALAPATPAQERRAA